LGFDFDGGERTLILGEAKRDALLATLREWKRLARRRDRKRKPAGRRQNRGDKQGGKARIEFRIFCKVVYQLRHAAICVPAGWGLLLESSKMANHECRYIYLKEGTPLYQELDGWLTLLREATVAPTKCTELVTAHPDLIGIVDASTEGVGGVLVGENKEVVPVVFRFEWPEEVRALVVWSSNPGGTITNSDLEMGGMFLLLLVIRMVMGSIE
jgi:hypothetical protein